MKYQAAESWPINWNLSGHWYFPPPMASILWPHGVLLRLPSKMEGTTCKKMLAKCAPTSWYFKCGIPGLFFLILSFSVNLSLYNGSTMTGIKLWISVAGSKWALTNIMNHPTKKKKTKLARNVSEYINATLLLGALIGFTTQPIRGFKNERNVNLCTQDRPTVWTNFFCYNNNFFIHNNTINKNTTSPT